jgi:competence ComEA-like helix-hairpin-helix protein
MTDATQSRIQSFAFVVSVCVCVSFSVCFVGFGASESEKAHAVKLDDRINPNDAPVASLVRLPAIGLSRAQAIVAYRESLTSHDSSRPAFRDCEDVQKVKGIGPKTAQDIGRWLKFE